MRSLLRLCWTVQLFQMGCARQAFQYILCVHVISAYIMIHPANQVGYLVRNHRSFYGNTKMQAAMSRQGAEQGSCCPTCYLPQRPGNKFCVSCGAPQLARGGIIMHWTFDEARAKQYTNAENGASSCGPCSILSSLSMIGEHANNDLWQSLQRSSPRPGRSCQEANYGELYSA